MCGKRVTSGEVASRSRYGRHMTRPLRILEPDGIYNVGSRGNNKETMFRDGIDWMEFLRLLARVSVRHRWEGWAYCLMGNHFHLVVQLPHLGLSEGMQLLNAGYAVRTNARYKRWGHLVRNRFYSHEVESEEHLLELCRYVVLNPVRAGLCQSPADWSWSSYRATAGFEPPHPFLVPDRLLDLFGTDRSSARQSYREFVREGISDSVPTPAGDPRG
jgi:REP-associated tyrosine transposase